MGFLAEHAELVESIRQSALEQGRQARAEEIITVLAHDLRNDLTPVTLRLLKMRSHADSEGRGGDVADADAALAAIARMSALVTDLLDTARLDAGAFEVRAQPVDLTALVESVACLQTSAEHEVIVQSAVRLVVMADPERLRQCLLNVIANAVGHSPAHAAVEVTIGEAQKDGRSWAHVEVLDEGAGIAEDVLLRVFDAFVTGRRKQGGVGLGLYIAKRIAEAHGGELLATRRAERGACFTLRLPALDAGRG